MTYPDNEIVTHSYKSQMLLNSVIGANTYVNSTTYDKAGRMPTGGKCTFILGCSKIPLCSGPCASSAWMG
jgi:hypothetical protein